METWSLPNARPISCNDCPTFQRPHMSALCIAESLTRLDCVINTTFREKIYSRWCCIDRLSWQDFTDGMRRPVSSGMRYAPNVRRAQGTEKRRPAMKKTSTVRVSGNMIFKGHKLTIGLDLGDRWSFYCVMDEAGQIIVEQKLATTPEAMKQTFGKIPRSLIALETGTHSPWVSRLLAELGHEVLVAHAQKVQLISKSNRKDDRHDARTLARLARIDPELLGPVRHRSRKAQADLTVIRARAGLVRARTSLINTARGLTKSYGERLRGCSPRKVNRELAEGLSPELQNALQPLRDEIESFSQRIREYNDRVQQITQESYPE